MKNWFKSLNNLARNILYIVPLTLGGGAVILYALFKKYYLLIIGLILIGTSIFFLALNRKIIHDDKTAQKEREFDREKAEASKKGTEAAAKIADCDIDAEIDKNETELFRYQSLIDKSKNEKEFKHNVLSGLYHGGIALALTERKKALMEKTKNQAERISQADELKKFKKLLDDGIITQEEFDHKKSQIIGTDLSEQRKNK